MAAVAAVTAALLLSGCFVLTQNQTFAVGTESNRANLVIYEGVSEVIDNVAIHNGSVAIARQLVLDRTPSSFSIPTSVRVMACSLGVAGCVAQATLPGLVMSWWRSDVRNRGDFHEAVHQARVENKCFAWTFVALTGRNFTVKPHGNSGCR